MENSRWQGSEFVGANIRHTQRCDIVLCSVSMSQRAKYSWNLLKRESINNKISFCIRYPNHFKPFLKVRVTVYILATLATSPVQDLRTRSTLPPLLKSTCTIGSQALTQLIVLRRSYGARKLQYIPITFGLAQRRAINKVDIAIARGLDHFSNPYFKLSLSKGLPLCRFVPASTQTLT